MSEFVVKSDGWLYKEGVKVALEFGNVEQIKAIRAYEKKMKSYAEGTIRPLISYETKGNVFFNCICDASIAYTTEADGEDDIRCFDNSNVECKKCNRKYLIYTEKIKRQIGGKIYFEDSKVYIKLKP